MVTPRTNLIGATKGDLTVIAQGPDYITPSTSRKTTQWICKCKCGNQIILRASTWQTRKSGHCGCQGQTRTSTKEHIKIGDRFSMLEVIRTAPNHITPSGIIKPQWLCRCDCGKEIIAQQQRLVRLVQTHCGCQRNKNRIRGKTTYDLSGDFGIGYTAKGEPFWFDLEDYDLIKNYTWRYNRGYVTTCIVRPNGQKSTTTLHQMVMPTPPPGMIIDHKEHPEGINSHKVDNRKQNLRIVSISENNRNRSIRRDNTSGHIGVYKNKSGWTAAIKKDGKKITKAFPLDQLEEAIAWRKMMEEKLFGEHRYQS